MLSALAAEHIHIPRNVGPLDNATHEGIAWAPWLLPGDGPYIKLWMTIEPDPSGTSRILHAAYQANGCPSSIACASMIATILSGRTVAEAKRLEAQDLILMLGGLPEGKEYCAEMAVTALRLALQGNNHG